MVCVNISAAQISDPGFARVVHSILLETGLSPTRLELEVTETVLIDDFDKALFVLRGIKDLGVALAIDDFGTGYSTLSYLRKLPIHVVKIDKSFVMQLHENKADRQIVETILSLAEAMKLEVIAEGVEQEQSLELLRELGCDYVQGFHVGHPTEPAELTAWIKEQHWESKSYAAQENKAGAASS